MPLSQKHLEALKFANIDYTVFSEYDKYKLVKIEKEEVKEVITFLHKVFPETYPIIPLHIQTDRDGYQYVMFLIRPQLPGVSKPLLT